MIAIAICDDTPPELQSTATLLEQYAASKPNFSYQLHTYTGATALLSDYGRGVPSDIILLDIYMEGISGVRCAQLLREQGYSGQIVFLTTSTLHALSAYEVDAVQYLVKPLSQQQFFQAMDKSLSLLQAPTARLLLVRHNGSNYKFPIESISFAETKGHYQEIHCANGEVYSMRSTATNLFDSLDDEGCFMSIGKMYIINYHFIKEINTSSIAMINGEEIHLSRRIYQKVVEQYFLFFQDGDSLFH